MEDFDNNEELDEQAEVDELEELEDLNFTLTKTERPVVLDGEAYKLVEMGGKGRGAYLNSVGKRMKFVNGKVCGMHRYDGMQADLLVMCLHGPDGKLVSRAVIEEYPSSVQAKLFKAAQKLNGLDEESAKEAKND